MIQTSTAPNHAAPHAPAPYNLAWFQNARRTGTTLAEALAFFDTLDPVSLDEIAGRWRGYGFYSGHMMDGLLEEFGWFGKEFGDPESVKPLLFGPEGGKIISINPATMPLHTATKFGFKAKHAARVAFDAAKHFLETDDPVARLRMTEFRGVLSATVIYDALPINDIFRRVSHTPNLLLGLMDYRDFADPYFFVLERR